MQWRNDSIIDTRIAVIHIKCSVEEVEAAQDELPSDFNSVFFRAIML